MRAIAAAIIFLGLITNGCWDTFENHGVDSQPDIAAAAIALVVAAALTAAGL